MKPCYLYRSIAGRAGVGLCWAVSVVWPAQVFFTATLLQEGLGRLTGTHSTGETWNSWGPYLMMIWVPEAFGPPLEKVLILSLSLSPGHCNLGPVQVPWIYPRSNSRWTPASRYLRCCQRLAVKFPWCLVTQWSDLGLQLPGSTVLLLNTSIASTFDWQGIKQVLAACVLLSRQAGRRVSAVCLSFGGGVAIADRQVSVSKHTWELVCTSTSASPRNLLWLWLHTIHCFSATAICCYSFGACVQ